MMVGSRLLRSGWLLGRSAKRVGPMRHAPPRQCLSTAALPRVVSSPLDPPHVPGGGSLPGLLHDSMRAWGDRTATVCGVSGRSYTYNQLSDCIARWSGVLGQLGVGKGQVVAVVMANCPEYPVVMLGSANVGVVVAPINMTYTPEEMGALLADCGARVVVCDAALVGRVKEALGGQQMAIPVVSNGPAAHPDVPDMQDLIRDPDTPMVDPIEVSGDDTAMMPFSSGTTAAPKGVLLSHRALVANALMIVNPTHFATPETAGDYQASFLGVLPMFHVSGIVPLVIALLRGLRMVYIPKFDPTTFVGIVSKYQIETLHTVPTLLNFLLHSPSATPAALSSVATIVCGAAPLAPSAVHAFVDKMNRPICMQEIYGMTEVLVTMLSPVGSPEVGTCGAPLPGVEARVVDTATGQDLPPNTDGEILIKTPTVMKGYHNNPGATADTIDADGWVHTGDVGHYTPRGFFKIVDRTKELMKVKGLQVAPSEIEDVLSQCPGVVEAGVVGVHHDRLGEAPRAYVVASKDVREEDVQRFVEDRVAPHKRLAGGVVFVPALPKNTVGKLMRRELRKMAEDAP